jgi:hypothetical protein
MEMNVFYLGSNIYDSAIDLISESDSFLLFESRDVAQFNERVEALRVEGKALSIDKFAIEQFVLSEPFENNEREQIITTVLSDFNPFLLRGRFTRLDVEGTFSGFCYIADIVDYAIHFASCNKINNVFCSYTPHTVESWVFIRTLEVLGIRIIRLIISPLPWILIPVVGLPGSNKNEPIFLERQGYPEKIEIYFEKLRSSYDVAKPYYEKIFRDISITAMVQFCKKWRPKDAMKYLEKRLVFSEFQAIEKFTKFDERYAIYFLHYQPEMNTVPEAGMYADQYQAIHKIASALPSDVKLIVKEHPSTFTKRCDRRWRPAGFYKRISQLSNVYICPLETDTFQLIDRALFISSISGVSLTEAIARGKPIVHFYSMRFSYFDSDYIIDGSREDQSGLREAIQKLDGLEKSQNMDNHVMDSFYRVVRHGYDGSDDRTFIPQSIPEAAMNSKKANLMAVLDVIDGRLN